MSGDWAKVELNTPDKPEVWQIAEILDIDPDAAFGKVFRIWAWFDEHTEDGNAPSVTKKLLDRKVGVTGFCESMLQAGWMTEFEGVITLTNFGKHNGETAKKRANTAKRVSQHRANTSSTACNAQSVTSALAREEKRREEKKDLETIVQASASTPEDGQISIPPEKPPQAEKVQYQKIVDLYHEILPELRAVAKLNATRQTNIRQRWKQDLPDLTEWRKYFEYVRASPFLMGRGQGERKWEADFDFLINGTNAIKIVEGKYHG